MAFFRDPDGNALMLHRRYDATPGMTTLTREQAATRFAELPLPSTSDEHWRFTDLRGFDPNRCQAPRCQAPARRAACSISTSPAARVVTENGIEIVSRARGRDASSCCRPTTRRS